MARGKEQTDDTEARLDAALVTGQRPSEGEAPAVLPDLQSMYQQFQGLMSLFVQSGMIHQRPDGTIVLPGTQAAKREIKGSACDCSQCNEHNQRHWICVICGSAHEYVIQLPRNSWSILGPAGTAGRLDAVCTDACAREYLQMQTQRSIQNQNGTLPAPMHGATQDMALIMAQGLGG